MKSNPPTEEPLEPELDSASALLSSISFEGLDSTDFEEFCHDLLVDQGFVNVDWLKQYESSNRPPFRVRYWERPHLSSMISNNMDLAWKHGVSHSELRPLAEIIAAENEMYEKVWYGRKPAGNEQAASIDPKIEKAMLEAMREIEAKYGKDALMATMTDDFSWGLLSGKLSTLRWILGEEWDFLDT